MLYTVTYSTVQEPYRTQRGQIDADTEEQARDILADYLFVEVEPTEAEAAREEVANDENWLGSPSDILIVNAFNALKDPSYKVGKSTDNMVDVSQHFNGYKATASKTWAERHLNNGGG